MSWSWPPLAVMPSLRSAPGTLPPSIVVRQLDRGDDGASARRGRRRARARAPAAPARVARASSAWRARTFSRPSSLDHVERDVEAEEERHGGRERAVALALALGGLAPVEVVAAAGLRARRSSSARSETRREARGRAGTSAPSASRRRRRRRPTRPGAARRRRGPRRRRRRGSRRGACATSAIAWTSWTMPVEVSLSVAKTTSMPSFSRQQPVDLGGVEALAPARLVADELGAVGLAELDPALAELAGGAGEHRRARARRGWRRRTPSRPSRWRRRRARRSRSGRPCGSLRQHALVELDEGGRAVVEHRRGHRLRDGGRDGRRPGGHEVLLDERVRGHRRGRSRSGGRSA